MSTARLAIPFGLLVAALALAPVAPSQAQARGRLKCEVLENGSPASGTMVVRRGSTKVAEGACGTPLAIDPGSYEVVVRLDGALDQPSKGRDVRVSSGATERVRVDFSTGTLKVRVSANGRRAAGMVTIYRDGKRIGTLGSGVAGHLSVGDYEVVVRYRSEEKRYEGVSIGRGQDRELEASF